MYTYMCSNDLQSKKFVLTSSNNLQFQFEKRSEEQGTYAILFDQLLMTYF